MPLLPDDETRLCPYNKTHEILVTRWDVHLIKCRKQHPNSGIVICKFVSSHHIPKEEIESHEKECAKNEINVGNAATLEPTFEIPDPMRAHRPGDFVIDPEWEEEVPTYDPVANAMSKPVVRLMQNMTKRERKEGREQERRRLRSLEEAAKKEKDAPKPVTPEVEGSMPRTLRRPNAENGPVETLETQTATGPRSSVLRNLSLNSTSSVRTTSGESAYDKYLRMEMAQEK